MIKIKSKNVPQYLRDSELFRKKSLDEDINGSDGDFDDIYIESMYPTAQTIIQFNYYNYSYVDKLIGTLVEWQVTNIYPIIYQHFSTWAKKNNIRSSVNLNLALFTKSQVSVNGHQTFNNTIIKYKNSEIIYHFITIMLLFNKQQHTFYGGWYQQSQIKYFPITTSDFKFLKKIKDVKAKRILIKFIVRNIPEEDKCLVIENIMNIIYKDNDITLFKEILKKCELPDFNGSSLPYDKSYFSEFHKKFKSLNDNPLSQSKQNYMLMAIKKKDLDMIKFLRKINVSMDTEHCRKNIFECTDNEIIKFFFKEYPIIDNNKIYSVLTYFNSEIIDYIMTNCKFIFSTSEILYVLMEMYRINKEGDKKWLDIIKLILKSLKSKTGAEKMLEYLCQKGHFDLIKTLDSLKITFTSNCCTLAFENKNYDILKYVYSKIKHWEYIEKFKEIDPLIADVIKKSLLN